MKLNKCAVMFRKYLFVLVSGLPLFLAGCQSPALPSQGFTSEWKNQTDRIWLGPEYWANRLQDWRVKDGRLETRVGRVMPMRTLHLLTTRLGRRDGTFEMSVRTGLMADSKGDPTQAAAGFLVGVGHGEMDYRSAAIVQWWPGKGAGIFAGISGDGKLFIRDNEIGDQLLLAKGAGNNGPVRDVVLKLTAHKAASDYDLRIEAWDPLQKKLLDSAACKVKSARLIGNLALVCHPGVPEYPRNPDQKSANFWYRDWHVSGSKLSYHPKDTFGPIVCTQYTLSKNIMKMTTQLMPILDSEPKEVQLQVKSFAKWKTVATAELVVPGWTATFRVPDWPSDSDVPYRVTWNNHICTGTVRRDPVKKDTIVVAGFTGNHNKSHSIGGRWDKLKERKNDWIQGAWFPHAELVDDVAQIKPDVLFFSGDQVYEGGSPTPADRTHIKIDYLYKWYLWCWAFRDLTANIPTITLPDDHDVYQGNLWGEGGRKTNLDVKGGYTAPADFVRMVERTQTSHLPDPYDPTVLDQGITSYYTSMNYGGIGFAILEDRKFKSGCSRPKMPPTGTDREDHVNNPDFDLSRLDLPGLKILGDKQMEFLNSFARDWKGQDMKIALSQTIFANVATHHGREMLRLRSDMDSNGWPQSARNRAVDALRRGFMFHLAGDQHLGSLVHHGIDEYGDAMWSMCVPSIGNFYPRAWAPRCGMPYEYPEPKDCIGEFKDGLGHPITVYAVTNPGRDMGQENKDLHNKMPGYGIVRMSKSKRTYTVECWPRFANPATDKQYEGWPRTIKQMENYGRKPYGHLPSITSEIGSDPVVQVINEQTNEVLYTLRIKGKSFTAPVFKDGVYTVKFTDPKSGRAAETKGLKPARTD